MPYCRKCNRKSRTFSWLAGPQTGLGRAPGRRRLVGVRPPDRPWPGSRPVASGGGPAPRPGSWPAALLVPVCRSMAGFLAGLGRSPGRRLLDGGRPRPGSRPATQFVQACCSSKRLVFVEGYLYPSIYLETTTTTKRRTPPLFESFKSIDLPL